MQRRAARFEARVLEHLVDEVEQRARVALHALDGVLLQGRERGRGVAREYLAQADDDVQGRAQLVAHVGDEGRLQAVVLAQAVVGGEQLVVAAHVVRDVAEDRDDALVQPAVARERRGAHGDDALAAVALQELAALRGDVLAALARAADGRVPRRDDVAAQVAQRHVGDERVNPVAELARLATEDARCRRVDAVATVGVHDDDALDHLVDDARQFRRARLLRGEGRGRQALGADALRDLRQDEY